MDLPVADSEVMGAFNAQNGPTQTTLIATFYEEAVEDDKATNGWTEEVFDYPTQMLKVIRHPGAGRKIYGSVDFIEIRIPGNLKEIRNRPVRESDKQRFPREWNAYKTTKENPIIGTPLEKAPFLVKSQVLELKAAGLRTVEDVRAISDGDGQKFIAFHELRRKAADFLAAAEGNAPLEQMRAEIGQRDKEIAALKAQMADVISRTEDKRRRKEE